MADTLPESYHSLLKGFLHTSKLLYPSNTAAEHAVNTVFQLVYHVSGSGNNCHTLLIILCILLIGYQQNNPVSHNRPHQTFKEVLGNLTESRIKTVCSHTGSHSITQNSIFHGISKLYHYHISIFLVNIQKLCIIILVGNKIILKQDIIDISTLDHRYHGFQFFPDFQIITAFLPGLVYLFHSLHTGFQYHLFIDRLGEKFHHSQIHCFLGIIKFIISSNNHKNH